MKITNALTAADRPNPHGVSAKPIYDSAHAMAVHITLQPGQSLKKHATAQRQLHRPTDDSPTSPRKGRRDVS